MKLVKSKINYSTLIRSLLFVFFSLTFHACMSIKPRAVKSGKKLYETFFVGQDGTQYFVKPLSFERPNSKDILQIDFTFRYKNKLKGITTINYSIIKDELFKNIDSLIIISASNKLICLENKLLFNEKMKKTYKSRFTTKGSLLKLNRLFKSNNWQIQLFKNSNKYIFLPSKRTKKRLEKLNNNVFVLF